MPELAQELTLTAASWPPTWAIYTANHHVGKIVDADVLPRWFFEKMSWF